MFHPLCLYLSAGDVIGSSQGLTKYRASASTGAAQLLHALVCCAMVQEFRF